MKGQRIIFGTMLIAGLWGLASCSNTKHLPAGESLYTGSEIKIEGKDISKKQKKALQTDLQALTRPRPNRKLLGMRIRLLAYNLAGNPKKENGLRGKLKYKFGEPPVVLTDVNLEKNNAVLVSHLENRGWFKAISVGDTVVKKRKATAIYTITPGPQYKIREVVFEVDSSFIGNNIRYAGEKTLLRPTYPFNLDMIKDERLRIDAYLKENGFYFFSPEYILVDADSTIGNNEVNLYVRLKPGTPRQAKELYTIKDVFIYANYRLNQTRTDSSSSRVDTSTRNATFYQGYYVIDRQKRYKPKMFEQSMQFNQNDVYNRTDHNLSLNRLVNLGVFKFVKNRFEVANTPFAQLNSYYYLTPLPKKSLRLEIGGNTKSNNLVGSMFTLGWRNRNTFRAGELFTVSASAGAEVQYSSALKGYNVYRAGLEAGLSFPRFLIPFVQVNTRGGFVPKTNIMVGYDLLNKQKLYTLNSFRTSYGYSWKESLFKEHQFNPISVNFVQPMNVSPEYQAAADTNSSLAKIIERQFILGSTYNWTYNELVDDKNTNAIYFSGTMDVSGNAAGLITGAKPSKPGKIAGEVFSQYVKAEGDFRVYRRLGTNSKWANRLIVGAGYPYGNSRELPFIKQFFIGGNNSIRAFRTRALGPGTFNGNVNTLVPDQSGDIKMEFNTELRGKLYSIFHGAVFVDAGNIWLYRDNIDKPGAQFSKTFLKELAVGTGIGLRIDVSILVLRLDVAFPLRKPFLPDGERWVIDKISFGSSDWRRDNLVYNLAIGYPF